MSRATIADFLSYLKRHTTASGASTVMESLRRFESSSLLHNGYERLRLDEIVQRLYPYDANQDLVPVEVYADGNCFFRAAALLLYESQERHLELRVHTIPTLWYSKRVIAWINLSGHVHYNDHVPFSLPLQNACIYR